MNMKSMRMYSTQYLVGAPFAWISAAMRRGMESISLWHCSGVMRAQVALIVAFSSSALLGLAYRIFLFTIPHRFSMGLRSGEFAGQLRTGIPWSLNQVLVALALCAGAKSCWKMKYASPYRWSAAGSMKCSKTSWYTAVLTLDLRKHSGPTPADYMAPQTITDCGNFTLDLKQRGFCASPLFLQTLGPLISKGNAKFTFIREHNFGPLSSSPVETLLTLSVVQEWLDTRNATAETHVLHTSVRSGSWSTDSSCSPLFVNLPHIFEWVLFHNPLQGAVIPIACTLFSTTSFPSLRPSINVLGHRALWTASLFCNDLLCLALLVQGVNGRLLDNCQVSSLPHDCVAYRTRLRDHLKAFVGVLS